MKSAVSLYVVVIWALLAGTSASGQTQRSNPFENHATDPAVAAEIKAALKDLVPLDELRDSHFPVNGLIATALPRGIAKNAGFVDGSVVYKIGDKDEWHFNLPRSSSERTYHVVEPNGELRSFPVPEGTKMFGINREPYSRPELYYLRSSKQRDPKWDRQVVIGAALLRSDAKLAETAWHFAIKAGYQPDHFSDFCAAFLLWQKGNPDQAGRFAGRVVDHFKEPEKIPRVYFEGLFRVAHANADLPIIKRLVIQEPGIIYYSPEDLDALAKVGDALIRPTKAINRMKKRDITRDLVKVEPTDGSRAMNTGVEYITRPDYRTNLKPGRFTQFLVGTDDKPLTDVELIAEFTCTYPGPSLQFGNHVRFIFYNRKFEAETRTYTVNKIKTRPAWGPPVMSVTLGRNENDKPIMLLGAGSQDAPCYLLPPLPIHEGSLEDQALMAKDDPEFPQMIRVHMVRIGKSCEVWVNNMCLAWMPDDRDIEDLALFTKFVGIDAAFTKFQVNRLTR